LTLTHHHTTDEKQMTKVVTPTSTRRQPQPLQPVLPQLLHSSLDAPPYEEICDLDDEATLTPYQLFSSTVDESYTKFLHDVNLSTAQRRESTSDNTSREPSASMEAHTQLPLFICLLALVLHQRPSTSMR
jgi:hypothetical protein